jgi:hypothetical protein
MSQVFIPYVQPTPTPAHSVTIQSGGSGYGAGSNITFGGAGGTAGTVGPTGTFGWSYTDQQHEWMMEYKLDPIKMGEMCEKFPALAKSWSQFKMLYNLCKSEESNE